jgi:glycosyltransferase involved in cell wall biosynthesis
VADLKFYDVVGNVPEKMKAKNILFIIPEMSMGGAQRSLSKISLELSKFYNVWIVVFNRDHEIAAVHTGEILSLDTASGPNPFTKVLAFFKRIKRLRALKRQLQIDVSISFLEGADYVNILSRREDKIILSIRGSKVHDENMLRQKFYLRKKIISLLYRGADAIVCVNKGILKELTDYYGIRKVPMHVIYNFYDLEEMHAMMSLPVDKDISPFYDSLFMAMSGRLAIEKGQAFIIEVLAELKRKFATLKLLLIGDGPERQKLIALCSQLGLSVGYQKFSGDPPDVFITGEQKNVFNHLKYASLYILNSSSEGFPNGLVEAMVCGLPVISADCPYGPREILAPDTIGGSVAEVEYTDYGVLVPVAFQDARQAKKSWSDTLATVLNDGELRIRYSNSALERTRDFSAIQTIKQWREIIEH